MSDEQVPVEEERPYMVLKCVDFSSNILHDPETDTGHYERVGNSYPTHESAKQAVCADGAGGLATYRIVKSVELLSGRIVYE